MAMKTRNFFRPRSAKTQNFTVSGDDNSGDDNGFGAFLINSVTPPTGSEIAVDNTITVNFSHPVNPGVFTYPRENGATKAGGLTWSADFTSVTFTPTADWAEGANVDWDLSGFQSAVDGSNPTNGFVAQWTVETLFALISVSPDPADTTNPLDGFDPIVATFTGPPTDLSALPKIYECGVLKAGSWQFGPGANDAQFIPATEWDGNCQVTLDPATGTDPNGDPIPGPIFNWTVPPKPFDYLSANPAANSNIAGTQSVTLTFSDDVAPSSNIVVLENGVPKAGTWTMNDVNAVFVPSTPWAAGAAVTFDTSAAVSVDGVANTTPTVVPYAVPVTFTQTAVSPVSGSSIFGTETITVSFNEAPDASTMPLPTEDGVAKPGTWVASGNDLIFTPSSPYTPGATVVVDWTSVTDTLGNNPTNPGAAAYLVKDQFNYLSSTPGVGGYLINQNTISLTFNRPIDPTTLPLPQENGVAKPGSWSFVGNVATFTPTSNWTFGTNVTVDYTGGIATDGVPISNPGTLSFIVPNQLVQTNVSPATGSTITGSDQITVTFNQPIDVSSMPLPTDSANNPVAGSWAASGSSVVFTPSSPWALGETFTVDWSAAQSLYTLPVTNPGTATYNTIPAFLQTTVSPTPGSYIYGTNGISVTFNRAVDTTTLPNPTSNGVSVPGSWSVTGSTATFTPTSSWTAGETVVMDWSASTDTLGNPVTNPNTATYQVAAALFQTAVAVEHSTTLAADDTITVTFDQPVDVSSLTAPTIGGAPVGGSWTASGNTAIFTPSTNWTAGQTVTVDWSSALSPLGVPVGNPSSTTFNTVAGMTLTGRSQPNGSTVPTSQGFFVFSFANGVPTTYPSVLYGDGSAVPGTWSSSGSNITFTPSGTLNAADTITIDVQNLVDANGHPPHNITGPHVVNTAAFSYASVATAEADGDVRDLETVTFTFNGPVDVTTLPANYTTSDATPAAGLGSWTVSGNTATFTPSGNWQDVGSGPYNFNLAGVTDVNGNVISNPQIVPVAEEATPFMITSSLFADGDTLATNVEEPSFTFSEPPLASSLPAPMIGGGDYSAAGQWVVSGNTATFILQNTFGQQSRWGNGTLQFDFIATTNAAGVAVGSADPVYDYNQPHVGPDFLSSTYEHGSYRVQGTDAITMTWDTPMDPTRMPDIYIVDSANPSVQQIVAGSWSAGPGANDVTFTPSADYDTYFPSATNVTLNVSKAGYSTAGNYNAEGGQSMGLLLPTFEITATSQDPAVAVDPSATFSFTYDTYFTAANGFTSANSIDFSSVPQPTDGSGTPIAGTWSNDFNTSTLTFTPAAALTDGDTVNFDLSALLDAGNHPIHGTTSYVYTVSAPFVVTSITTSSGNDAFVDKDTPEAVIVTFNKDVASLAGPVTPTYYSNFAGRYASIVPSFGAWSIGPASNQISYTPTANWSTLGYAPDFDQPLRVAIVGGTVTATDGTAVQTSGVTNLEFGYPMSSAGNQTTFGSLSILNQNRWYAITDNAQSSTVYVAQDFPVISDGVEIDMSTLPTPVDENGNAISGTWAHTANAPAAGFHTYKYTYASPLVSGDYLIAKPAGIKDTTGAYIWAPDANETVIFYHRGASSTYLSNVPMAFKTTDTLQYVNAATAALDNGTIGYTVNGVALAVTGTGTTKQLEIPAGGYQIGDVITLDLTNLTVNGGTPLAGPTQVFTYVVET